MSYVVGVGYDKANHRYYVLSSDIPGLNVEEESFEAFVEVVLDLAPELIGGDSAGSKIVFEREVELVTE
ncbi:MAG: hypothetical protein JOZ84_17035 [Methylobacteriaceae bacterium]|nr:hypothetical protein [Methylobacteriaceae bacterium]